MKQLLILFYSILLIGCANTKTVYHIPVQEVENSKKLVVFMDGTMNNASSYTNVSKLYNLTILQNNPNINATYIVGVGANGVGVVTGIGIGKTVRDAYLFLAKNYKQERKDEIYIFGFSRGAYATRILAGLIHVAGITDLSNIPEKQHHKHIKKIYLAYKGDQTIINRRKKIAVITGSNPTSVAIEFVGLWDTVEALGIPNFKENYDVPNKKYVDQLCNVKRASQALSINDDRATIFTPKLLTKNYLIEKCEKPIDISKIVNEVWFFGAHSDVGGGYRDTELDGVSLNWMIQEIMPFNILPPSAQVYQDTDGITHDPDNGIIEFFYKRKFRSMSLYARNSTYNDGRFKVHKSAIVRLNDPFSLPLKDYEKNLVEKFPACFKKTDKGGFIFEINNECKLEIYSKK